MSVSGLRPPVSRSLLVDLYELSMVDVYRRTGMAERPATFSLFVRSLPERRNYLVAAGLDDALDWLETVRFGPDDLAAIEGLGRFDDEFLAWLEAFRFTGSVRAVPEGTIVFPEEPILEVDAPIAHAQLAESYLLNQITLQTTLATKAARCRHAARGRAVIDFALRRTHGVDAAMKLARVGRIVGLDGTSNIAGAVHYGVPANGTMAHSFVQAHEDETDAFRAFASAYGSETVLLVDTYDTARGVDRAIEVAAEMRARGDELRGIRIDSGDLGALAHDARRRLDDAGFDGVSIFASGGLDEYAIEALVGAGAPIDGFGVGTAIGVSSDAPDLETAYKLVAFDGNAVRKTSAGKASWPGAKQVWRDADWGGDTVGLADEVFEAGDVHPLLDTVMENGERTPDGDRTLDLANEVFEAQWEAMPPGLRRLDERTSHPVHMSSRLISLARSLDAADGR